jgi:hypothetical protein
MLIIVMIPTKPKLLVVFGKTSQATRALATSYAP